MHKLAFTVSVALIGISACTNTDNPQLAMCQAVTKQLTGNSVSSWDADTKNDAGNMVNVKVDYTNSSGQAGSMKCAFKKQGDGTVDTAPTTVVMNNQPVDRKTLIKAGTEASKELLAGTYKNTVKQSAIVAEQAKEVAGDLANKAADAAVEGAKALQDLQK